MNIDDYVNYFVPSDDHAPPPECPPVSKLFSNIVVGGPVKAMYPLVVSIWDKFSMRDPTYMEHRGRRSRSL